MGFGLSWILRYRLETPFRSLLNKILRLGLKEEWKPRTWINKYLHQLLIVPPCKIAIQKQRSTLDILGLYFTVNKHRIGQCGPVNNILNSTINIDRKRANKIYKTLNSNNNSICTAVINRWNGKAELHIGVNNYKHTFIVNKVNDIIKQE